jgi:hypothetical protein
VLPPSSGSKNKPSKKEAHNTGIRRLTKVIGSLKTINKVKFVNRK